ncbi:ATP-binding cassette domain-containing protein [Nonomuraea sp. NPDC050691]|uniref:ABC transporter ATP-binding protein n=1 Tax=Nonomuraea sp. NPDC050691 TaxID=3155661 RepID=UPI0033FAC62D
MTPCAAVRALTIAAADGRELLTGATLTAHAGQILALAGPSGSGKTTLLKAMIGDLPPGTTRRSGTVEVLGVDVLGCDTGQLRALRRTRVAYVGQDPGSALNPWMRVSKLITEIAPGADAARLLDEVRLAGVLGLLRRRAGELSGGQQRRVALARALARRPDLLLLDEPTAGLDPALRDEIGDLLHHLAAERGITVVLSCHDRELVARLAGDVLELPGTALPRPAHRGPAGHAAEHTPGHTAGHTAATRARTTGLRVRGLAADVGPRRVPVLRGIDLDAPAGDAVAVVGPSGAGKTTLLRALAGLHPFTAGTVTLDGAGLHPDVRGRTREQRRRVQYVPQNPMGALNPSTTVAAALARPLRLHRRCSSAAAPARVAGLLEQVGLGAEHAGRYPRELSGGQRQRVSVARALASEPDVLICDEITSALDGDTALAVMELLARLRRERGVAVVFASHDLPLVGKYADAVVTLGQDAPAPC